MKPQPHYFLFIFYLAVMGYWSSANAFAADLLEPQQMLYDTSEKIKARVQDPHFVKDFKQFTQFIDATIYPQVDFNRISALVLGRHWKEANTDQQERFKTEFKTLLVRTYSRAFIEFREWSVRFLPLTMEPNDTKITVKTEVLQPGQQPVGIEYRMVRTDAGWKVYDITIEGVSLVTNYRNSFKTEIERSGSLESVITTLATRNAEALREPNGGKG